MVYLFAVQGFSLKSEVEKKPRLVRDALAERVAIPVPTLTSTSMPNDPAKFRSCFGAGSFNFGAQPNHSPRCGGCVLLDWLRAGNPSANRGISDFLKEALAHLTVGWKLRTIRVDSGFFAEELLEFLEARELP